MQYKSEVASLLLKFLVITKTQVNKFVKCVRSDNGAEFVALQSHLEDHGVLIETSCVYTPQQNRRAERFIRTFVKKAQAMCLHTCSPPSYWEFTFSHAAHVYNRTPKQGLNWRTPAELLLGKPPSISHL